VKGKNDYTSANIGFALWVMFLLVCLAVPAFRLFEARAAHAQAATVNLHEAAIPGGNLQLEGLTGQGYNIGGKEPLVLLSLLNNGPDLILSVALGTILKSSDPQQTSFVLTGQVGYARSPEDDACGIIRPNDTADTIYLTGTQVQKLCLFAYALKPPDEAGNWAPLNIQGREGDYTVDANLAAKDIQSVIIEARQNEINQTANNDNYYIPQYAIWLAADPTLDWAGLSNRLKASYGNGFRNLQEDEQRTAALLARVNLSEPLPQSEPSTVARPTTDGGGPTKSPDITAGPGVQADPQQNELNMPVLILIGVVLLLAVGIFSYSLAKRDPAIQPMAAPAAYEGYPPGGDTRQVPGGQRSPSERGTGVGRGPQPNVDVSSIIAKYPGRSDEPSVAEGDQEDTEFDEGPKQTSSDRAQPHLPFHGRQPAPPVQGSTTTPRTSDVQSRENIDTAKAATTRSSGQVSESAGHIPNTRGVAQPEVDGKGQVSIANIANTSGDNNTSYTTSGRYEEAGEYDAIDFTEVMYSSAEQALSANAASTLLDSRPFLDGIEGELKGELKYLQAERSIITRDEMPQVVIDDKGISAPHALFTLNKGVLSITDLRSNNGTHVKGRQLEPDIAVAITVGEVARMGNTEVRYESLNNGVPLLTWRTANGATGSYQLTGTNRWMVTRTALPFIVLSDDAISAPQAYLDLSHGFELHPFKIKNPIRVDGQLISGSVTINRGSRIVMGRSVFQLRMEMDKVPDEIGPYRVLRFLAPGGMADVLLVTPRNQDAPAAQGEQLALKYPKESIWGRSGDFRRRWEMEIQMLKRVSAYTPPDSNIIRYRDDGRDISSGLPYLVMNYVDGCSLHKIRRYRGQNVPLEVGEAYDVGRGIAGALIHLHNLGIAHCDLKPGNLLFDRAGRLHLADFGIATPFGIEAPRLTTRAYMAPEVPGGVVASARIDIFSLGAILYVLLTGNKLNVDGNNGVDVTGAKPDEVEQTQDITGSGSSEVRVKMESLPPAIREILGACISLNPEQRPTAQQVLEVLSSQPEQGDLAALIAQATASNV
jgi:hypothetical protein